MKNKVSKNDALFLLNLYESTMNQHLHFDNQKYDEYNKDFVEWYRDCRAEFFASFENLTLDDYAAYAAGDGSNTINATLKWFPKEKAELLKEKYEVHKCMYKMN